MKNYIVQNKLQYSKHNREKKQHKTKNVLKSINKRSSKCYLTLGERREYSP